MWAATSVTVKILIWENVYYLLPCQLRRSAINLLGHKLEPNEYLAPVGRQSIISIFSNIRVSTF